MDQAEKLTSKGDYTGALKEHEEVLRLFPGVSPGDRALFHMGLIWAHPDNPRRNYKKALECFHRLLRDFPRSTLKNEVNVWINTINELIRYEGRIKALEEAADALKKQLNALKEIDVGIEEKKREDLPGK